MNEAATVINRFIKEYQTGGDEAVADELLAVDFVDHTPFPGFGTGSADVKRLFAMLRTAFPDLRVEVWNQLASGDRVATWKTFYGTHRGEFLGNPPTGRRIAIRVPDIVRVEQGRLTDHWNVVDIDGLIAQIRA